MGLVGICFNGDMSKMTPKERRDRIRPVFSQISACNTVKEEVRLALDKVWVGGLYDGDATVQPDNIDEALHLLRQLDVDGVHLKRRDAIDRWLIDLQEIEASTEE